MECFQCARVGTQVANLTAIDDDYGDNARIKYELVGQAGQNNQSDFSINSTTGILTTIKLLDAATVDEYKVRKKQKNGFKCLYFARVFYTFKKK